MENSTILGYSDTKYNVVQAMPLKKGMVNLTSGVISRAKIVYCVSDGNITINWLSGGSDAIAMLEGDSFYIEGADYITINSPASLGKFHVG